MKLENKVALVTGGAKGIGYAIAERFLQEGARVVIADIDGERGSTAIQALGEFGACRFVTADVGDSQSVAALVQATIDFGGQIDILANNAGIVAGGDFLDVSEADFDRVIRVNLKGAFLVGQAVARHMAERVRAGEAPGTIINMSSINAIFGLPNQVGYSASKGGIMQLTKSMAVSLASLGIRVNAIGPGSINTEILTAVNNDPQAMSRILSRTPLGRIGEPSEIAAVAAFLASDDASYITGETIYVDGGRLPLNYTVAVKAQAK